jgi:hypothetical protein
MNVTLAEEVDRKKWASPRRGGQPFFRLLDNPFTCKKIKIAAGKPDGRRFRRRPPAPTPVAAAASVEGRNLTT